MNKLLVVTLMDDRRISCFCSYPKNSYFERLMYRIDGLVKVGCIDTYEFHTLDLEEKTEIKEYFENRYYSNEYPEAIVEKYGIDDLMKIGDFAKVISEEVENVFTEFIT